VLGTLVSQTLLNIVALIVLGVRCSRPSTSSPTTGRCSA
jgi:hypothetical protein